jgi:hypothetical protein
MGENLAQQQQLLGGCTANQRSLTYRGRMFEILSKNFG